MPCIESAEQCTAIGITPEVLNSHVVTDEPNGHVGLTNYQTPRPTKRPIPLLEQALEITIVIYTKLLYIYRRYLFMLGASQQLIINVG